MTIPEASAIAARVMWTGSSLAGSEIAVASKMSLEHGSGRCQVVRHSLRANFDESRARGRHLRTEFDHKSEHKPPSFPPAVTHRFRHRRGGYPGHDCIGFVDGRFHKRTSLFGRGFATRRFLVSSLAQCPQELERTLTQSLFPRG